MPLQRSHQIPKIYEIHQHPATHDQKFEPLARPLPDQGAFWQFVRKAKSLVSIIDLRDFATSLAAPGSSLR